MSRALIIALGMVFVASIISGVVTGMAHLGQPLSVLFWLSMLSLCGGAGYMFRGATA